MKAAPPPYSYPYYLWDKLPELVRGSLNYIIIQRSLRCLPCRESADCGVLSWGDKVTSPTPTCGSREGEGDRGVCGCGWVVSRGPDNQLGESSLQQAWGGRGGQSSPICAVVGASGFSQHTCSNCFLLIISCNYH